MKRLDELINKYLDSDITESELEELQQLLKNENNYENFTAFKAVENRLRQISYESAPALFTERLMSLILKTNVNQIKKSYFPIIVNTFFSLLIIMVIVLIISLGNWNTNNLYVDKFLNNSVQEITSFVPLIKGVIKNRTVIFFSSIISLILLVAFYYTFESHKSFKKKLENY
ncbi:MAG: hypothetical protein N2321_10540 [Melioribacteraceae bacterium]|nr:hypothetical protein [Melioribacteraceae bacterium]